MIMGGNTACTSYAITRTIAKLWPATLQSWTNAAMMPCTSPARSWRKSAPSSRPRKRWNKDSGTLYKAHVMRVLWQYGLSDGMYNTVYRSLFGLRPVRGKILHTPVYETVDTILNLIQECRGVAVLAHPSVYHSMPLARELIAAGRLDGVEIDHPRNTEEDKAELEQLAAEYGLIVTGGTDYHGMNTNTPHPVGTCTTADEQIARIRALAEARKK